VLALALTATVLTGSALRLDGGGPDHIKMYVKPPRAGRLAGKVGPGAQTLAVSGGTLLGQTKTGSLVINVLKKDAATAKEELTKIGAKVGTGVTTADAPHPARTLLVKYQNKEAALKELDRLGYVVVDDYQPGSLLRVAPKEKGSGVHAASVSEMTKSKALDHVQLETILRIPTPIRKEKTLAAKVLQAPNDPFFEDLWGIRAIKAPDAWKWIKESEKLVAVIDTGIDYNHEDLKDNIWTNPKPDPTKNDKYGYDFVGAGSGDPRDRNDHGTHCAGTIGAVGDNMKGVIGVNWKVKIMVLRSLDANGQGPTLDAVKCIDYALARGVKVISASWGGDRYDQALFDAIQRARDKGVLFVAAAGNDGNNNDEPGEQEYPCSYDLDNIISVMAVDEKDQVPDWSGYGKKSVHIAAPGVDILSCRPADRYQTMDGTSMATPHVAGAAALVWSDPRYAKLDYKGIRKLLLDKARPVKGLKCISGGVLDLSFLNGKGKPNPGGQGLRPALPNSLGNRQAAGDEEPRASVRRRDDAAPGRPIPRTVAETLAR